MYQQFFAKTSITFVCFTINVLHIGISVLKCNLHSMPNMFLNLSVVKTHWFHHNVFFFTTIFLKNLDL